MKNFNIPVVYYHSVGPVHPSWVRSHLTLEMKYFEDQIKKISKRFSIITLKEFWEARNGIREVPDNALVITFDDGFLDNWVWAFPVLKKFNIKATLFVNPEFIDTRAEIRPLSDPGKTVEEQINKLENWGYLSWDELVEMEKSGLIDVQSHTLTHTKYFVSDELIGFTAPGGDNLYVIGNEFVNEKPYHITNPDFDHLLPFGYPLFRDESAVVAKRVWINESFTEEAVNILKKMDWGQKDAMEKAFKKVQPVYTSYKKRDEIVVKRETKEEYENRVRDEIIGSKKILEEKLNKTIEFLCWPHGDNNQFVHETAMKAGYLATTLGKYQGSYSIKERIDSRIGTDALRDNIWLTTKRLLFNINVYRQKFPHFQLKQLYYRVKSMR